MNEFDMTGLRGMIEQMPTEQLDELLRQELEKEPVDEAAVRLIMSVLKERDQGAPIELNERMAAAWEKYQAHAPVKRRPRWLARITAVIAVILALALAVPQSAEAEDFWERLSRWTDSVFEFFAPGDEMADEEYVFKTDNPGLQQVYDTVTTLGITDPVVPMWLPEGYELVECKVNETPSKTFISGHFSNNTNTVMLDIAIRDAESPRQYTKDEENADQYEIADVDHIILHNEDWWTAAWTRDRLECAIYIDCQEENLYKILKSIYTMEAD